jgi:hypothetical protein
MHCKSCLRKSHYFSKCLHPYCELCYKTKTYCDTCKTGKSESVYESVYESVISSILRYLNLY